MYLLYFDFNFRRLKPFVLLSAFDALVATANRCGINIILRRCEMNSIAHDLRCVKMYRCHVHIFFG